MNTDAISKEPFVFIDGTGKPFKVALWGVEWWMFYWHEGQKSWVSLRKITEEYVREFRPRALKPEHAKLYDDLHDQFSKAKR